MKPIEGGNDMFKKQTANQQRKKTGDSKNIPFNINLLRLLSQE
jgi:hypothetical protein